MTAMLNIKDLRAYYGQVQALHGLSFALNEGSLTTLLGANGAGKTTTLRAICNMVRSTGAIEFEGKPLSGKSTENVVRLGIAHVPQGRGTFTTMTVEENLQLGAITRTDKKSIVADIERDPQAFHRAGLKPPPPPEGVAQRLGLDAGPGAERVEIEANQKRGVEPMAQYWDVGRILDVFIARRLNIRVYQGIGFFSDIFVVEDDQFAPLQQTFFTARFHFRVIKIIP